MHKFIGTFLVIITTLILINKTNAQKSGIKYITTDDSVRLFTKQAGNGPICIFIHGGPGAWSKSFETMGGSNLESRLTMIYYDQRGCGRSGDAIDGDYSLNRMLKDIEQIRIKYKAQKVYLLAHSFGGILATNYAIKYPQNVQGIILANCTLDLKYSIRNQVHYMNALMGTHYKISNADLLADFIKVKHKLSGKNLDYKLLSDNKENIERLNRIDKDNPSQYTFAKSTFGIKDYLKDYTGVTKSIQIPTLIITGKKDHAIGENHYKSFMFPHKTIAKIDGGHILYYEKNKAFVNAIFKFAREQPKSQ